MKNVIKITVILFAILITSCSQDENEPVFLPPNVKVTNIARSELPKGMKPLKVKNEAEAAKFVSYFMNKSNNLELTVSQNNKTIQKFKSSSRLKSDTTKKDTTTVGLTRASDSGYGPTKITANIPTKKDANGKITVDPTTVTSKMTGIAPLRTYSQDSNGVSVTYTSSTVFISIHSTESIGISIGNNSGVNVYSWSTTMDVHMDRNTGEIKYVGYH